MKITCFSEEADFVVKQQREVENEKIWGLTGREKLLVGSDKCYSKESRARIASFTGTASEMHRATKEPCAESTFVCYQVRAHSMHAAQKHVRYYGQRSIFVVFFPWVVPEDLICGKAGATQSNRGKPIAKTFKAWCIVRSLLIQWFLLKT